MGSKLCEANIIGNKINFKSIKNSVGKKKKKISNLFTARALAYMVKAPVCKTG